MSHVVQDEPILSFRDLALAPAMLQAVADQGYEAPSTIQALTIPPLLEGRDVLGQAQTGTGKTAAFALPLLTNLDLSQTTPQILVLAPTRELAMQVSEAFEDYAAHLKGFRIHAVYGGQDYAPQLRALKRGVHVVVGTPGRIMDHMRKGSLSLDALKAIVLDEADEMLRMGFAEDVEWILSHAPEERQTALFSATMPTEIRRIAKKYLKNPAEIRVEARTVTAETIRQRYWLIRGLDRFEALDRLLETEPTEGVMIFVRTKNATLELADQLSARNYRAAALNGDMAQSLRERTVEQLKRGELDILVATDVAARGLDVERVSHVINYEIPYDTESYIHRIGRTGRAGRSGEAILFISYRERRLLSGIEKVTGQKIEPLTLPDAEAISRARTLRFEQRISDVLASGKDLGFFRYLVSEFAREHEHAIEDVAAALALLAQGDTPLVLPPDPPSLHAPTPEPMRMDRKYESKTKKPRTGKSLRSDEGLVPFRVEIGRDHGARPSQLVGAIANEANLDSACIGRIEIHDSFTIVDLPEDMQDHLLNTLGRTRVNGQLLNLSRLVGEAPSSPRKPRFKDSKGFVPSKGGASRYAAPKAGYKPTTPFRKRAK